MNKRVCFLPKQVILLTCAVFFASGFTDFIFKDDVVDEVREKMADIQVSTRPSISLADEMDAKALSEYEPYQFIAEDKNPFVVKDFVARLGVDLASEDEVACQGDDCGDGPPVPHAKYFLENYNIDQLTMIGSIFDKRRGRVALIQTPDVGVIYTSAGEYLGRNNGLILSIDDSRVLIREKYRSPKGWQDRMARLPLLKK